MLKLPKERVIDNIFHIMIDPATQDKTKLVAPLETSLRDAFPDYVSIISKINAGVERGMLPILFTDIDSTLVLGSGYHMQEIAQGHEDAQNLISQLNYQGAIVIPITGSHFHSATETTEDVLGRINGGVLPQAGHAWPTNTSYQVDAYVTEGGAQAILARSSDALLVDSHYKSLVEKQQLCYEFILETALHAANQVNSLIVSSLDWSLINQYDAHSKNFRIYLQNGTTQGEHREAHKVAFYFYAQNLEERDLIESHFIKVFEPHGLKIVCCEEKDANSRARRQLPERSLKSDFPFKYCLDIVPYNKATPVEYFSKYVGHLIDEATTRMNKEKPQLEVWACGDAANDLPMLSSSFVTHVVIVGGASAELIRRKRHLENSGKWVYQEPDKNKLGPASIINALNLRANTSS